MKKINLDQGWAFRRGFLDSIGMLKDIEGVEVNLPHDGMISTKTSPDAPGSVDSGFFCEDKNNYTKYVNIPKEWEGESIGLKFDGSMMHATVDINGNRAGEHHYGYSPFYVDISDYVAFGEDNRITINNNTGVQPSCRWYTGSGLYRSVELYHAPRIHVKPDGIFVFTKEVSDNMAFLEAQVEVCNETLDNHLVSVEIAISKDGSEEVETTVTKVIQVNARNEETAKTAVLLKDPILWDVDTPNLYRVHVTVTDKGLYRTRFIENDICTKDEDSAIFGIRTITVDALRGLRINNKTVKLKGGCVHHDNGLLGAASLYESEVRKIKKLKEIGFNAIRTAHNPPSSALVEACDRVGMYIFDEAFDSWGIAKRPGDFSSHFKYLWEQELVAFVKRDRIHPSVIMWSTGNEIPERGGLNNGYTLATQLAECIRKNDGTRPISNGICSYWAGLDDELAKNQDLTQNAKNGDKLSWAGLSEPFTNGLDVVGYNYMEDDYENTHTLFPERVILGSENFPREIGFRWPMVERLPYVIGDFTWTAWDYIGEAGIGKSVFVDKDDPLVKAGPWAIMPQQTSYYPWRLANDADYDITGRMKPQGTYRSVVWGDANTYLYVQHPMHFGKAEVIGMWGFTDVLKCWNYGKYEGKPVQIVVFSNADEVELILNGRVIERKTVGKDRPLPNSVYFDTVYEPGTIEAVSYKDGKEVSRDCIKTSKPATGIRLVPEKECIMADGHDVLYVGVDIIDEDGQLVPDAQLSLTAAYEGEGTLAGFGTGNPMTEEVYTDFETVSFKGHAMAVIRSGYNKGKGILTVSCKEINAEKTINFEIK